MSTVLDDLGRSVEVRDRPSRIVSLVPSITELVFELGAGRDLVGATSFCTEPADAVTDVERVGGTKNPSCERIAALRPDIVFLDRDENRVEDFDDLSERGLNLFVAQPRTAAGAARTIEMIGAALGAEEPAKEIAEGVGEALAEEASASDRVRVFCPIWRNPWMSFNGTTYAADLIRVCGGTNVCNGSEEVYPKVVLRDVAALDPQVVLLPDEPYIFEEKHIAMMSELQGTAAWRDGRVHLIDGKAMFWYGARTTPALRLLRSILLPHPTCDP